MQQRQEYTQRHLTPRGWEIGHEKRDNGIKERAIPVDRVFTITWTETCNGYGPISGGAHVEFGSPTSEEVAVLIAKFGEAERAL